jgi:iron complex outermembrane receptor protein
LNCAPASIQPAAGQSGAGLIFYSPTETGAAAAAPGRCDFSRVADILPRERRDSVLVKLEQRVTPRIEVSGDLVYSHRLDKLRTTRGSVAATIFGPGSAPGGGAGQINPFFAGPPGVTTETVRFDANELLGPGAFAEQGQKTAFGAFRAAYDLGGGWQGALDLTLGRDDSLLRTHGALCSSCAILALNGTLLQSGSTTTPSAPAVLGNAIVTSLPLTAANALDVFNPRASNRTAASVLAQLTDSDSVQTTRQTLADATLKFDGPLFRLPAGPVKAAFGGEATGYGLKQFNRSPTNTGPASTNSQAFRLGYTRTVGALFGELLVPLVGPDMGMPGVRKLDLSLAGRFDHYSDVGGTTNPKLAATWEVVEGLSLRGAWGTSFTAPALTSRGNAQGITAESSYFAFASLLVVPLSFPGASALPGCTAGGCTIGNAVTGIQINGGNKNLKPQEGETWSIGADFHPTFLRGLRASVTYWTARYERMVSAVSVATFITPGLYENFIINPTPAQIAAYTAGLRQTSALPAQVYFIFDFRQRNAGNLDAAGVDVDASYRFSTDRFGDWEIGGQFSNKTRFDQQAGPGGAWIDRLNTAGVNVTFSSLKFTGRGRLGWRMGGWAAEVFVNYVNSYLNLNGSAPFPVTTAGSAVAGGQRVKAWTTFDAHAAYDLPAQGWLKNTQVFIDGSNIFDRDPPFYNVAGGYDVQDASALGRVVTIGARKRW